MSWSWHVVALGDLSHQLTSVVAAKPRPYVVAVDGHSSSGKTTLATRLSGALPNVTVLHTDDLAWHHSVFDWQNLLVDGVLEPARAGRAVAYRPPAWDLRRRPGAIEVPAGIDWLIIEGVGSSRRELQCYIDASIWVESPAELRDSRDAARIAAGEMSAADYQSWMKEENSFIAADRPWERALAIMAGSPVAMTRTVKW